MMVQSNSDDVDWVAVVADAVSDNRIRLAAQGIHCASHTETLLYSECLARLISLDGDIVTASKFLPELDRSGITPVFDRKILSYVLDELDLRSDVILGCNISTDLLASSQRWHSIVELLEARPHLANRLILEITETRPLDNIIFANKFLKQAQKLGCRIAVDDFGGGYLTPWQLLRMEVDIVKLDAVFVRNIRRRDHGPNSLESIIEFAKCAASTIVIEGVETDSHLEEALSAGCTHVQGFYLSRPELIKNSR